MSKNFELLQRVAKDQFFSVPDEPVPPAQEAPEGAFLQQNPPDTEITKLVQRLFTQPSKGSGPKVVSFSGITRDDRSSWICARAGEALAARVGTSVCIVDTDLTSPQLHIHLSVENRVGLADALNTDDPIRSFAMPLYDDNFWLISAGLAKPGPRSPVERYRRRFTELREEFDYILLSAPALSRDTEATFVGQLSDGVVLIVEANQTRRESVRQAKELLETAHIQLLGGVLDQRTFPIPEFIYRKV
jgi:Mrp family chromosome partitioning ATPase